MTADSGTDPDDLAAGAQILAAGTEDAQCPAQAGAPDAAEADADVDAFVVAHRPAVLDQRLHNVELHAAFNQVSLIVIADMAHVLGERGVEVGEVVRVEDNALRVDLGIADAQLVEEREFGSLHAGDSICLPT